MLAAQKLVQQLETAAQVQVCAAGKGTGAAEAQCCKSVSA